MLHRKIGIIALASAVLLAAATQSTFASAGLSSPKAAPPVVRQAVSTVLPRASSAKQLALVPLCYYEYEYVCAGGRCIYEYEWYCP